MLVVSFVSQKGGVAKSTLSRLVAREAASAGWRVKIADLDTQQGTSTEWARRRMAATFEPLFEVAGAPTARIALDNARDVDLLVIDAPARASEGTLTIAKESNLVVQPTSGSWTDPPHTVTPGQSRGSVWSGPRPAGQARPAVPAPGHRLSNRAAATAEPAACGRAARRGPG